MKKGLIYLALLISSACLLAFINPTPTPEIAINSSIPMADLDMQDVGGKFTSLNMVKTTKGLLVIFSCNTCPYVKLSETRIKEITDNCKTQGIGCVIINSNEAQRADEDSFEAMQKYATEQKLTCSYVLDANSKLANAFGATRTPQCFLFNAKGLIYKGAIDDNVKDPKLATAHYLKDAITALEKGEKPKTQETKSIGCTIKRQE